MEFKNIFALFLLGFLIILSIIIIIFRVKQNSQNEKEIGAGISNEPSKVRLKLIKDLSNETISQTINNLPLFNDNLRASALIGGGGRKVRRTTYEFQHQHIPRLNRVRKIIGYVNENKSEKEAIGKFLSGLFSDSIKKYAIIPDNRPQKNGIISEPEEEERCMIYAQASSYILAEFNDIQSFPLMFQVLKKSTKLPINRLFLAAMIHKIIYDYPIENLTLDAKKAHQEYLEKTSWVPKLKKEKLPAWNSKYEEWDFRKTFFNEDLGIQKQPHIILTIYPSNLTQYEDSYGELKEDGFVKLKSLEEPLEKLIKKDLFKIINK